MWKAYTDIQATRSVFFTKLVLQAFSFFNEYLTQIEEERFVTNTAFAEDDISRRDPLRVIYLVWVCQDKTAG